LSFGGLSFAGQRREACMGYSKSNQSSQDGEGMFLTLLQSTQVIGSLLFVTYSRNTRMQQPTSLEDTVVNQSSKNARIVGIRWLTKK
jgi:hypothetical protein